MSRNKEHPLAGQLASFREMAAEARRAAALADTPELRQRLHELAKSWERLIDEVERGCAPDAQGPGKRPS